MMHKMMLFKTKTIFFLLLVFVALPSFADYNRYGLPDSSEIRKDLLETWFLAPLSVVRMNKPEIRENRIGEKFKVHHEETDDTFNIFVSPYMRINVDVYSDKGKIGTSEEEVFVGDAPGSWVLIRSKKTGEPLFIRCFFANDSDVYVQFSPYKNQGAADFIIYNCYAAKGFQTGIPFERFYTASFAEMQKWTQNILPWKYTEIDGGNYHATLQMIATIRKNQDRVVMTKDAMYDGDNNPVYISTGKKREIEDGLKDKITVSSLGFLKWIGDGLIIPFTGSYLKREPLIEETVSYKKTGLQGITSETHSIYLGLDWIRNLASAISSIKSGRNFLYNESGVDVQTEPFTANITERGIENTYGFIANTGYMMDTLRPLLYVCAVIEPDNFYFASLRQTDRTRSPEIKFFNDGAVFFPYFDKEGHFKCVVFKDGAEHSLDDFIKTYSQDYIYLVRVHTSEQFVLE